MTHPSTPTCSSRSPSATGRPLTLRNRVVMGSMHTGLEDRPWDLDKLAAYFAERARGGAGLIVTGGYAPNKRGWLKPFASGDDHPPPREAAPSRSPTPCTPRAARSRCRCCTPAATATTRSVVERLGQEVADHAVQAERHVDQGGRPHRDDFAKSVALARKAGYDAVEIMGSEGYLINQFLAARTNDRTDRWGGSAASRDALPGRGRPPLARAGRRRTSRSSTGSRCSTSSTAARPGRRPPSSRCTSRPPASPSSTPASAGTRRGCRRSSPRSRAAPGRSYTARLKQVVDVPVCASNRINTPELAEDILARGEADLVSMARPFLADPGLRRQGDGRARRRDQHLHRLQPGLPRPHLQQQARLLPGQPARLPRDRAGALPDARASRRVAVVGAGPAGLAAAVVAPPSAASR